MERARKRRRPNEDLMTSSAIEHCETQFGCDDNEHSEMKGNSTENTILDPNIQYLGLSMTEQGANAQNKVQIYKTPTTLPDVPYQPDDVPPYRDSRRPHLFQRKWYLQYPWLHYDVESRGMYCFQCLSAVLEGVAYCPLNNIFAREGFRNWKKGVERFRVHENSTLHRETVQFSVRRLIGLKDKCLGVVAIATSIQCLVSIGYDFDNDSLGNLMEMRRQENSQLDDYLDKLSFTGEDERELISMMAVYSFRNSGVEISNSEICALELDQVETPEGAMWAVHIRTVKQLQCEELYLGLCKENSGFDMAAYMPVDRLRVHCCDSIPKSETIRRIQPLSIGIRSSHHNLIIAIQDSLRNKFGPGHCLSLMVTLKDILSETRLASLFKENIPNHLVPVCPKKNVVTVKSISAILTNYADVLSTLKSLSESTPCSLIFSVIHSKLQTCEFFFYFLLCKVLFYPLENLAAVLAKSESFHSDQKAVESGLKILESFEDNKEFDQFWYKYSLACKSVKLTCDESSKKQRKCIYFDTIRIIKEYLSNMYNFKGYQTVLAMEKALYQPNCVEEDEYSSMKSFCDVNFDNLNMEKTILSRMIGNEEHKLTIEDIISRMRQMETTTVNLFPECVKLLNMIFLARGLNVKSSRMRSLKKFLRINKSKEMVNELSALYVYRDEPSLLNLKKVAQEYITGDPHRVEILFNCDTSLPFKTTFAS